MDDLSWRDCINTDGVRLRINSRQEPYGRVVGAPVKKSTGEVEVILNVKNATHWMDDLLSERFPEWKEAERMAQEPVADDAASAADAKFTLAISLKGEDAMTFMREWIAFRTVQTTGPMH